MRIQVKPSFGHVVVRENKPETKTKEGVILPQNAQRKQLTATVVAVGPGDLCEGTGQHMPLPWKVGDQVLIGHKNWYELEINDEKLLVLGYEAIIATLVDEEAVTAKQG